MVKTENWLTFLLCCIMCAMDAIFLTAKTLVNSSGISLKWMRCQMHMG